MDEARQPALSQKNPDLTQAEVSDDSSQADLEKRFIARLIESGLLLESVDLTDLADDSTNSDWTPIPVQGKPLSQEIIEDRR